MLVKPDLHAHCAAQLAPQPLVRAGVHAQQLQHVQQLLCEGGRGRVWHLHQLCDRKRGRKCTSKLSAMGMHVDIAPKDYRANSEFADHSSSIIGTLLRAGIGIHLQVLQHARIDPGEPKSHASCQIGPLGVVRTSSSKTEGPETPLGYRLWAMGPNCLLISLVRALATGWWSAGFRPQCCKCSASFLLTSQVPTCRRQSCSHRHIAG